MSFVCLFGLTKSSSNVQGSVICDISVTNVRTFNKISFLAKACVFACVYVCVQGCVNRSNQQFYSIHTFASHSQYFPGFLVILGSTRERTKLGYFPNFPFISLVLYIFNKSNPNCKYLSSLLLCSHLIGTSDNSALLWSLYYCLKLVSFIMIAMT